MLGFGYKANSEEEDGDGGGSKGLYVRYPAPRGNACRVRT